MNSVNFPNIFPYFLRYYRFLKFNNKNRDHGDSIGLVNFYI